MDIFWKNLTFPVQLVNDYLLFFVTGCSPNFIFPYPILSRCSWCVYVEAVPILLAGGQNYDLYCSFFAGLYGEFQHKITHNHRKHHPASRLFLLLAWFWRTRERLCLNRVKPLLSMRCMLLGYTFEPRPNGPVLGIYSRLSFNHRFIKKQMLALEKPVWQEKTGLTSPEVRTAVISRLFSQGAWTASQ